MPDHLLTSGLSRRMGALGFRVGNCVFERVNVGHLVIGLGRLELPVQVVETLRQPGQRRR